MKHLHDIELLVLTNSDNFNNHNKSQRVVIVALLFQASAAKRV